MGVQICFATCPKCHKTCSAFEVVSYADLTHNFYSNCCGSLVESMFGNPTTLPTNTTQNQLVDRHLMGYNGPPPNFHVHNTAFVLYNPATEKNMRDEVNRKVMLDLFASPFTLVPVIGGLTLLILSVGLGSMTMAGAGIMSTLVGLGIFSTKLIFGLDKITEKAYKSIMEEREKARNDNLDHLDRVLRQDKDPRPEQCLVQLRSMHKMLKEAEDNSLASQILGEFERLFDICVKQIVKTDELWRAYRQMNGAVKQKLKEQREQIVSEIEATTQQLALSVQQIKTVGSAQNDAELEEAKKEFEQRIVIAKRVDERLANLNQKSYDIKEFE